MDEPFGAVDEITRGQLQTELKRIHSQTGITVLFVTHDISEALKLGTKVLVMNSGKIEHHPGFTIFLNNTAAAFAVYFHNFLYCSFSCCNALIKCRQLSFCVMVIPFIGSATE